jgi:uncharacterized protein YoaH (UPF0181 family)
MIRKLPLRTQLFIQNKIAELMREGYPQKQAIAIAYAEARKKHPKMKSLEPTKSEKKYYPSLSEEYGY